VADLFALENHTQGGNPIVQSGADPPFEEPANIKPRPAEPQYRGHAPKAGLWDQSSRDDERLQARWGLKLGILTAVVEHPLPVLVLAVLFGILVFGRVLP
jgi:hypothetical protein